MTKTEARDDSRTWLPPEGMDKECTELCAVLNEMPGIQTIESCCGHGVDPYRVWFTADTLEALPLVLWSFDGCHCGHYGWRVVATTDCAMSPVAFMVEGPTGPEAYEQSEEIAGLILRTIEEGGPDG